MKVDQKMKVDQIEGRILACRDNEVVPLFGHLNYPLSPSPTLPIETHEVPAGVSSTQSIPGQVITMFLQQGSLLHSVDDRPETIIDLPEQSIAISLRNQQEWIQWASSARYISVGVNDGVLERTADQVTKSARFELSPCQVAQDRRLSALFYILYLEQQAGFPSGRLLVEGVEQAISALIVTKFNSCSSPLAATPAALSKQAAERVISLMHAHLDQPLSLSTLATCAGYSEAHFSSLFRKRFGEPPHRYLLRLRVEHAKRLLIRDGGPIIDIALACGFANAQHFTNTFKRLVGSSPSSYRRLSKK